MNHFIQTSHYGLLTCKNSMPAYVFCLKTICKVWKTYSTELPMLITWISELNDPNMIYNIR